MARPDVSRLTHLPRVQLYDFWLDQYEVSNKRFKEFVDGGGYQKRDYWREPFIRDARKVAWDEAIKVFRDSTARPGPSTWELGNYPKGKDDYPVNGVSWYEAAAYAEFAGKKLPTVYHWSYAAGIWAGSHMVPLSNIEGRSEGPLPVGERPAMSPVGAYDMAGNVKEWCWNESRGAKRYLLGGAWNEPSYMFMNPDAQPWDRSPTYGFRCASAVATSSPSQRRCSRWSLRRSSSPSRRRRCSATTPGPAICASSRTSCAPPPSMREAGGSARRSSWGARPLPI